MKKVSSIILENCDKPQSYRRFRNPQDGSYCAIGLLAYGSGFDFEDPENISKISGPLKSVHVLKMEGYLKGVGYDLYKLYTAPERVSEYLYGNSLYGGEPRKATLWDILITLNDSMKLPFEETARILQEVGL